MSRTTARETAYLVLFSNQFRPVDCNNETILDVLDGKPIEESDLEFVKSLVSGVMKNLAELQELVKNNLSGYTLDRVYLTDLTAIILGAYEMKYCDDIPNKVAINEAINLAKKYSSPKGAGFVNSILSKINKELSNE